MADSIGKLLLGLMTGFVFGFLLQKGHVTKYKVIVGQFLLRDFTVLKTMLTAVVVGGAGVYGLRALGLATLHVNAGSDGGGADRRTDLRGRDGAAGLLPGNGGWRQRPRVAGTRWPEWPGCWWERWRSRSGFRR